MERRGSKARIAVFAGPLATVMNTTPLVTSDKARRKYGLPMPGSHAGPDVLRPQRLAAPVTVYVRAYSAHPLEAEMEHLYAPVDGWLDDAGVLHDEPAGRARVPVYVVELRPEDGLYPLPYMARQADGSAWEFEGTSEVADLASTRQTFYPDASRLYEEIDRLGITGTGSSVALSEQADFDFFRAAPSGGWTAGRSAVDRTDEGAGPIPPERNGLDYYGYSPPHLYREPSLAALAHATNLVHRGLRDGRYDGAQWLESSPTIEDSLYWLGLLIDTDRPIVGHAAQRAHGALGGDGDRNIADGVRYIISKESLDESGRDRLGAVLIVDQVAYSAREVTKVDARPGGYEPVGGHGGIVADLGGGNPPQTTFVPHRRHTYRSEVRLSVLPSQVRGVAGLLEAPRVVDVRVKTAAGELVESAVPSVDFVKYRHYVDYRLAADEAPDVDGEVGLLARIRANLAKAPLAGFVVEGMVPYGMTDPRTDAALRLACVCGMPVVRVGAGAPGGRTQSGDPYAIAGNNLAANKARMLLMAGLLRFGALPPATNPLAPTDAELRATREALVDYQWLFDTH